MKFIISHDVDHLYREDHYHDLIYPKLWVRETLAFLKNEIPMYQWKLRVASPFQKVRHHIPEVLNFDYENAVPSTFFIGVSQGKGLSYGQKQAEPMICFIKNHGSRVGVHGICFDLLSGMKKEYMDFSYLSQEAPSGIRMHYVRLDSHTLERLNECGYIFDSSEFDKHMGYCLKSPYKVGNMWEFPLTMMDGYLPYSFEEARKESLMIIKRAEEQKLPFVCVLFHDYFYCNAYQDRKRWYEWLVQYIAEQKNHSFISYEDAIKEMEA